MNYSTSKNSNILALLKILAATIGLIAFTSASASSYFWESKKNAHLIKKLKRPSSTALEMMVFDCGKIQVNEGSIFNEAMQSETIFLNNTCYLIKHPIKGTMIWDTGLEDAFFNQGVQTVFDGAVEFWVDTPFIHELKAMGTEPATIKYMAISHLHFDHTGNMLPFVNARWLIQKDEYNLAFSPDASEAAFNPEHYNSFPNHQIKKLRGHYDVFGDGSVYIIRTPGHTIGHQALYVKLPNHGPVLLSGDLYHFEENREGYVIPSLNSSKKDTVHSFSFVDHILDETGAEFWIQHDKERYRTLKVAPFVYK